MTTVRSLTTEVIGGILCFWRNAVEKSSFVITAALARYQDMRSCSELKVTVSSDSESERLQYFMQTREGGALYTCQKRRISDSTLASIYLLPPIVCGLNLSHTPADAS
jgi:hypothetical protein